MFKKHAWLWFNFINFVLNETGKDQVKSRCISEYCYNNMLTTTVIVKATYHGKTWHRSLCCSVVWRHYAPVIVHKVGVELQAGSTTGARGQRVLQRRERKTAATNGHRLLFSTSTSIWICAHLHYWWNIHFHYPRRRLSEWRRKPMSKSLHRGQRSWKKLKLPISTT